MGSVTILHLDGASANGEGKKLVSQANTHDRHLRGLHQLAKVVDGVLTVSWITGSVGDEDTIVVIGHLLDLEVVGEYSNTGSSANQASQDVLLDTTIDQRDVVLGVLGLDNEGSLSAHPLDEVDLTGIDETLILIGIILVTNRDPGEGGTLLTKVGNDSAGVHSRNGGNALTGAPLAKALDSGPVAILRSDICNHDTSALDVGRLEVLQEVPLVTLVRRDTVVANERLCEDEDLASVGRIGHGLGIAHERGGEDGFTRDVGVGSEGSSTEDGAILIMISVYSCYSQREIDSLGG